MSQGFSLWQNLWRRVPREKLERQPTPDGAARPCRGNDRAGFGSNSGPFFANAARVVLAGPHSPLQINPDSVPEVQQRSLPITFPDTTRAPQLTRVPPQD